MLLACSEFILWHCSGRLYLWPLLKSVWHDFFFSLNNKLSSLALRFPLSLTVHEEKHFVSSCCFNIMKFSSFCPSERVVFECHSAPPQQFSRTGVHQCSVNDSEQRSLVLVQNSMELHAVMLQGGADNRKGNCMSQSSYMVSIFCG